MSPFPTIILQQRDLQQVLVILDFKSLLWKAHKFMCECVTFIYIIILNKIWKKLTIHHFNAIHGSACAARIQAPSTPD